MPKHFLQLLLGEGVDVYGACSLSQIVHFLRVILFWRWSVLPTAGPSLDPPNRTSIAARTWCPTLTPNQLWALATILPRTCPLSQSFQCLRNRFQCNLFRNGWSDLPDLHQRHQLCRHSTQILLPPRFHEMTPSPIVSITPATSTPGTWGYRHRSCPWAATL
jgi:hypothetical protein